MKSTVDREELVRRQKILHFWRDVEMFDVNQVMGARSIKEPDGSYRQVCHRLKKGAPLPWEKHAKNHMSDTDEHMWFHLVYGGNTKRIDLVEKIVSELCPGSGVTEQDIESFTGDAWAFAVMLTSEGRPFRESFTVANYAVATDMELRGQSNDKLLSAIDALEEKFRSDNPDSGLSIHPSQPEQQGGAGSTASAETRAQPAPAAQAPAEGAEDGDDAGNENSSDWTIGEHVMSWEALDEHLALRNRIMGKSDGFENDLIVVSVRMEKPRPAKNGKLGKQRMPEWSVMNSFYLEGLQRVVLNSHSIGGTALEAYLSRPVPPEERHDLISDPEAMAAAASPARAPLGRWPTNPAHPLMFGQQVAVAEILEQLGDSIGLVAVNGPPGTGKTTLLRDIIAHVVVERAMAIARLQNPRQAFLKDTYRAGEDMVYIPSPDVSDGFGIVVASANNAAVDNISREIPLKGSIDAEKFPSASYLPSLGGLVSDTRTLYQIKEGHRQENAGKPAWGLLGAALGKRSNLNNFFGKVFARGGRGYGGVEILGLHGELQRRLDDMRKTGRNWQKIRTEFLQRVDQIGRPRNALVREENELRSEMAARKERLTLRAEQERLQQRLEKPHPSDGPEHAALIRKRLQKIALRSEELAKIELELGNPDVRKNVVMPDERFLALSPQERQAQSLWAHQAYDGARSRLFMLALELIEATLAENSRFVTNNMKILRDVLTGRREDVSRDATRALWDTLFMVVPVASTTLASLPRNFANTGAGHIGWLLVDEAGQAAPQIVAEGLWRSRRAVIIGDPRQIEPVITIPPRLVEAFREKNGVDQAYSPVASSAQVVADQTMRKGSIIQTGNSAPVWTGLPLRAHRRCAEPMFSISNRIAYDGQMVQATPSDRLQGHALGHSSWFDVGGLREARGKVVLEEIDVLASCLDVLGDDWPEKDGEPSEIFVITPFRDVAGALEDRLRYIQAPARIDSGTVHTFQGREADVVFLVLGSACGSAGKSSRNWAARSPNILNVAVTRARSRLHVIGSAEDWSTHSHFDILHQSMADAGRVLTVEGTASEDIRDLLGLTTDQPQLGLG